MSSKVTTKVIPYDISTADENMMWPVRSDGMHVLYGETFFTKDNRFHRIGGPARYLANRSAFHYVNGIDVTVLVEDMYGDGIIEWIDETMYKHPELDLMTKTSCFTVELATSHCRDGPTYGEIFAREWMGQ